MVLNIRVVRTLSSALVPERHGSTVKFPASAYCFSVSLDWYSLEVRSPAKVLLPSWNTQPSVHDCKEYNPEGNRQADHNR